MRYIVSLIIFTIWLGLVNFWYEWLFLGNYYQNAGALVLLLIALMIISITIGAFNLIFKILSNKQL